jgi:hypothetical protein
MYLLSAGKVQEAGKPDHTRNGAHGKSHKHTDDNLLHNNPFILQPAKARTVSLISASHKILAIYKGILIYQLFYSGSASKQRIEVRG